MNTDKLATMVGALLAGLVAASVDYGKLLEGDKAEIGKAISAVLTGLLGYLTNKVNSKPQ